MYTIISQNGPILANENGKVTSIPEGFPGPRPEVIDFNEWKRFYHQHEIPQGLNIDDLGYSFAAREESMFQKPLMHMRCKVFTQYLFGSFQYGLSLCQPIPRSVFLTGHLQPVADSPHGFTVYQLIGSRFALTERQKGLLQDIDPSSTQLLIRLHGQCILWDEMAVETLYAPSTGRKLHTVHQMKPRWAFFKASLDRSPDIQALLSQGESVVAILQDFKPITDHYTFVKQVEENKRMEKDRSEKNRKVVRACRLVKEIRNEPYMKSQDVSFTRSDDSMPIRQYGAYFGGIRITVPLPEEEAQTLEFVCSKDGAEFFVRTPDPFHVTRDFTLGKLGTFSRQLLVKAIDDGTVWGVACRHDDTDIITDFKDVLGGSLWMLGHVPGGIQLDSPPDDADPNKNALLKALSSFHMASYQNNALLQEWRQREFLDGLPIPAALFIDLLNEYEIRMDEAEDILKKEIALVERDGRCSPPVGVPAIKTLAEKLFETMVEGRYRCPVCNGLHQLEINGRHWYPITHDAGIDHDKDDDAEVYWDSQCEMYCRECQFTGKEKQFLCQDETIDPQSFSKRKMR